MIRTRIGPSLGACVVCAQMFACGSGGSPTPGTPGPSPSPTVVPASAGFLHVLTNRVLTSYRIDAATGRLQATSSQATEDVHRIAGEANGRFVYMAYGPRNAAPPYTDTHATIVAYAPGPQDGALRAISEATSNPVWHSSQPVRGEWESLTAGTDRVYGIWATTTYHDVYYDYVTHPVGADGQMGAAYDYSFDEFSGGSGFVDGRTNIFYKQGLTGLTAHSVDADGHLTRTGYSDTCAGSQALGADPRAAARGFVLAAASVDNAHTLCSYEGLGLASRANLGFTATFVETFVPRDENVPAQLAVPATVPPNAVGSAQRVLRLYFLLPDGRVQLQSTVETSAIVTRALFHPAGRFLFASVGTALEVYTVDSAGHLASVESLPDAAGPMAVTYASGP
jgi:hypothetical protein